MNETVPRILIIDDEESICWGLAKLCANMSIDCKTASSAEAGLKLVDEYQFQAIILDIRLPGIDGIAAIEKFHERLGPVPIITITAFGDLKTAILAIQKGAFEYIVKPFELEVVQRTIKQGSDRLENRQSNSPSVLSRAKCRNVHSACNGIDWFLRDHARGV